MRRFLQWFAIVVGLLLLTGTAFGAGLVVLMALLSWLITRDVIAGRKKLNFDDWQTALARGDRFPLDQQVQREISRSDMPPSYFLWLHPDAKLTTAEQQQLIDGLARTIQAK